MNRIMPVVALLVIIVALVVTWFVRQPQETAPVTFEIERPLPPAPTPEPAAPIVRYPVAEPVAPPPAMEQTAQEPQPPPPKPLPTLDESDVAVEEEIQTVIDQPGMSDLLLFQTFVRNFVVITDNVTSRILPQKYYFFRPPTGAFLVQTTEDDRYFMDPRNYERYAAFMQLVNNTDIDRLVSVYTYLYPLFQQAYEELGYPDGYFNDRLVEVITHLLNTPQPAGPVELVRPKVYYEFADPALEQLSAGQKILIRIGPDNAAVIRWRLEELLRRITALGR